MSAEPEDRRFGLDESGRAEDDVPVCLIGPAVFQVWEPSSEALDAHEVHERQIHRADLLRQLLGSVKERGREPVRPVVRVRVLAVGQVASNHLAELAVEEKFTHEAVEQRREPADGRHGDKATGSHHASGFFENQDPVGVLAQVVKRAEDQHDIEAVIGKRQPAGIGNLRRQTSAGQPTHRHVDVPGSDIEEMHAIAVREQPIGMHSGAPADIENPGGRSRQMPTKDLPGSHQFERGQPCRQPVLFEARLVVRDHVGDVGFHRPHGKAALTWGPDELSGWATAVRQAGVADYT